MKKFKRFLALVICAALLCGISIPASATGFTDISSSYAYLDAVNYVSDNDIMTGTTETTFAPNNAVTRAMMVSLLYRKAGKPDVTNYPSHSFTDVPYNAYYADAVKWAVKQGITSGTSTTTFSPNRTLNREQAMCFLYNYSKVTTTAVNKSASITGYSDYSSVSSYARNAMSWAVGNEVLIITETNKLTPQNTMSRIQTAYAITTFGTNVERIVRGKDNLRFVNSKGNFTNEKHYLTTSHYNFAYNRYYALEGTGSASDFADRARESWEGACYGMTAVHILDKYGKIAFNENYGTADNMYGVFWKRGSKIESAINTYQLLQSLTKSPNATSLISTMNLCMNSSGPVLLCIGYRSPSTGKNVGHAIIANSCTQSGNTYTLHIIDPNCPSKELISTLTTSGVFHHNGEPLNLNYINGQSNFSSFNSVDIDNYKNTDSSSNTPYIYPSAQKASEIPCSILTIKSDSNFTVENSEGKVLSWSNFETGGDMEVFEYDILPKGEDFSCDIRLKVPFSESFTFKTESDSEEIWFGVAGSDGNYSRVSGTGIQKAFINQSTAEISGENVEFEAAFSPLKEELNTTVSGSFKDTATIKIDGDNVVSKGLLGTYEVKKYDDASAICVSSLRKEVIEQTNEVSEQFSEETTSKEVLE